MAIQKITAKIIADGAIIATDIADGSITTAKIADANVTAAKLATGAALPSQSGNTNYYLTTDGTNSVWKAQTALAVANTQLTGSIEATQVGTTVSQLFGMRNRIINGAMEISQRNGTSTVTPANADATYLTDRFRIYKDSGATLTSQQSTTAPTGFTNSLLFTVSTGSSPTSAQEQLLMHTIEGFNIADLGWGTANAQTITLSFRVRSSVTGTFAGALHNISAGRNYVFNYTILAANTWETKTITVLGDTTGTWLTTNGAGITVIFDLGSGSNYETTADTWGTGNKYRTSGAVKLAATTGATFYITGVQLEIGSTATPFERRMYGTELALCQRYYQQWGKSSNVAYRPYGVGSWVSSTRARIITPTFLPMRTTPSFTYNNPTNASIRLGSTAAAPTAITLDIASPEAIMYNVDVTSGGTEGRGTMLFQNDTNSTSLELSAEF